MYKKISILSPAGANANYIMLVLQKREISYELYYHSQGTHHGGGETFKNSMKHFITWNDSLEKLNNDPEWFSLHNIVDQKFYFVIINWWEKLYYNANGSVAPHYAQSWFKEQTKLWKNFDYPIVRANLNWFYGYKNKNRPELVNCPQIKNKFYFDAFYSNYKDIQDQFLKLGVEYTEQEYKDWKNSQRIVFNSFQEIQDTPINQLTKDYQKAIALGFLGIKNKLSEQECWDRFKSKLN